MTQYTTIAMRSLLSECQTLLWIRRKSNFIYAHNKSTALPQSILLKLARAQQHYAHLSNPQSDPNRTINVECKIINQLTRLSEAWLSLRRLPRNSNHAIHFVDLYYNEFYPNWMKSVQSHRKKKKSNYDPKYGFPYMHFQGLPILCTYLLYCISPQIGQEIRKVRAKYFLT